MIFPLKPAFLGGFLYVFPWLSQQSTASSRGTGCRLRSLAESQERNELLLNGLKALTAAAPMAGDDYTTNIITIF